MTIVARLAALLTANSTQFEGTLKRANASMSRAKSSWNSDLNSAGRNFSQFETQIRRNIGSITDLKTQLGGLAVGVASALSTQKIIEYSDTWRALEGRLKIVTKTSEEMAAVQQRLFNVAQNSAAPLRDVTDAYAKMSLALDENQRKQYDLVNITDLLSKTLLISGTNAAGAATFFQQFGQAASGDFKAVGQELQTFQDQNAYFVQVLKNNLDLGGKTLKQFVADGDLSFAKLAQALQKAEQQIRADAESIPLTVGRALQKLDNAFLTFIGQTDAIRRGTGSLALVISTMADNFGILATAAAGLAAVMGARMVGALAAAITSFVTATASSYAYQLALARMAGISATAATATLGLSAALNTTAGGIALLGGPLGVALLGTLGIMTLKTHAAGEAQRVMNQRLAEHREAAQGFIYASKERRKEIEAATRQNIANMKKELEAVVILFNAYQNKSFAGRFAQNLGSKLGIGKGAKDIALEGAALEKALSELEKDLATFENYKGGSLDVGSGGKSNTDKQEKKLKSLLDGLREESEQVKLQTGLYGKKEGAVKRAQEALKIEQAIRANDITLTKEQQAQIEQYLDSIEATVNANLKLEQSQQRVERAAESMGQIASDALTDAITEAKGFGDVLGILESALKDVEKALVKAFISDPIGEAVTTFAKGALSGSGGSGLGSLIGDFFGFGSFATGIDYVPRDMYAKIHRGEKVVTAAENRNPGGGDVSVIINNNSGADVRAASRQTGNGTELTVMIDQVTAENISRKGSKTNEALTAMQSRTIIKR